MVCWRDLTVNYTTNSHVQYIHMFPHKHGRCLWTEERWQSWMIYVSEALWTNVLTCVVHSCYALAPSTAPTTLTISLCSVMIWSDTSGGSSNIPEGDSMIEDLSQLLLHWCRKTEGVSQPSVVRCVHCPNHGMQTYSVRLKSPWAVIMKANQQGGTLA